MFEIFGQGYTFVPSKIANTKNHVYDSHWKHHKKEV